MCKEMLFDKKGLLKNRNVHYSYQEIAYLVQCYTDVRLGLSQTDSDEYIDEVTKSKLFHLLGWTYPRESQMRELMKLCDFSQDEKLLRADIMFDLVCIYETAELICSRLTVSPEDPLLDEVAYYTSLHAFRSVLDDDQQKLTLFDACYMNDPLEEKILTDYLGLLNSSVQSSHIFLKSFSAAGESFPMWNKYGENHRGLYVKIDRSFFENLADHEEHVKLYRVVYWSENDITEITQSSNEKDNDCLIDEINQQLKKLKIYIDDIWNVCAGVIANEKVAKKQGDQLKRMITDSIHDAIRYLRFLCKSDTSAYEKELRIVYEPKHRNRVMLIPTTEEELPVVSVKLPVPLCVSKVVLGACFENTSKAVPYLANRAYQMCPSEEKDCFFRKGIGFSELLPENIHF